MTKENFERLVDNMLDIAEEVDFFIGVPYNELFLILKDFDRRYLKKGANIFGKEWQSGRVCLVMSGEIGLYIENDSLHSVQSVMANEKPMSILKKTDTFGQIGAMSPLKRTFNAKVVSDDADVISFCIDFTQEAKFPRGFLALYKNAFFRLGSSVLHIAQDLKQKRKITDQALQAYLSNVH